MHAELTRREFMKTTAAAVAAAGLAPAFTKTALAADEFLQYDGLAQATLVKRGDVTALELLEAAIARAEALNPKLNAIVTPMYDLARKRAGGVLPNGTFKGLPTLMKDLLDYGGVRTAYGSRLMMQNVAKETHPVGKAMEHMGMVVFGKTNTPEFGLLPATEPLAFGPTNNPWNLEHSPGGSSGGTAAAVAAGIVPIAQGSDGGGSIRIPACNCGIFGLKPSRNRIVQIPGSARPGELSVRGYLSRSVRDMELALIGTDAGDESLPRVNWPPRKRAGVRIAYSTSDANGVKAHPEVVKAVEATAKLCDSLGCTVEEAKPAIDGEKFARAMLTLWADRPWNLVEGIKARTGSRPPEAVLEPWTWGLIRWMDTLDEPAAVAEAAAHMLSVTQQITEFFGQYDLYLSPVLAEPAAKTGHMGPAVDYDTLYDRVINTAAYTPVANATGCPAMSVPLHWTPEGIPVGSQFMAPLGEERQLLLLAKQLEQIQPWRDRWPGVSAKEI